MIHHDFWMHQAGVFLFLLLFLIVLAMRAIGVDRPYLCADAYSECEYAN